MDFLIGEGVIDSDCTRSAIWRSKFRLVVVNTFSSIAPVSARPAWCRQTSAVTGKGLNLVAPGVEQHAFVGG